MKATAALQGACSSTQSVDHRGHLAAAQLRAPQFSQQASCKRPAPFDTSRLQASGSGRGTQRTGGSDTDEKPEKDKDGQPFNKLVGSLLQNAGSWLGYRGASHCLRCKGTGTCECDACRGSGLLEMSKAQAQGGRMSNRCTRCRGVGRIPCPACGGRGYLGVEED